MIHLKIDTKVNRSWKDDTGRWSRMDGPAIEYMDGTKWWCIGGDLHRTDGPAIEAGDGRREYWINGKEMSKEEFDVLRD